jgi:hypothetical protein
MTKIKTTVQVYNADVQVLDVPADEDIIIAVDGSWRWFKEPPTRDTFHKVADDLIAWTGDRENVRRIVVFVPPETTKLYMWTKELEYCAQRGVVFERLLGDFDNTVKVYFPRYEIRW